MIVTEILHRQHLKYYGFLPKHQRKKLYILKKNMNKDAAYRDINLF